MAYPGSEKINCNGLIAVSFSSNQLHRHFMSSALSLPVLPCLALSCLALSCTTPCTVIMFHHVLSC